MKMTDTSERDDCFVDAVVPAKKKKMKQAQLPFQIRSPTQSPNVIQNKKRKLSSPSVGCKSPKVVKISKADLDENVNNKSKDTDTDTAKKKEDEDVEIIENMEIENLKENTSNQVSPVNKSTPLKQSATERKRVGKQKKLKPSSLTKFLKKTDKEEHNSKDDDQNSLTEDKDKSMDESFDTDEDANVSASNKAEVTANDSLSCDIDSEVANASMDSDDQLESTENMEKNVFTSDSAKTPKTSRTRAKKSSPKQEEKKLLSVKKKEEMLKRRKEREQKLEEERNNRRKEKEMKRKEREEKIKAEKEQKLLEKKMKEQKKQQEIELKQKEKQAKEEERKRKEEAKEEEKRKKEEERLEAERKKQKAASNFTSFFVTKKQEKSVQEEGATETKNFMPFEVKADMKMAPISRRTLSDKEKSLLDEKFNKGNTKVPNLYLKEIKNKEIIPRKSSRTWPPEAKDDVILLDEENDGNSNIVNQNIVIEKHRPKLLQFSENQRPPYWGTWRKRSRSIKPRRPFSLDTELFNYEVDSDEEWEEEEPGESLHGSEEEKDEENPDDNEYDVDNEFMVPHGYLSDEELRADGEDKEDMTPETQKFKLKVLGQQFESERNTKTSKLKPKIIGCVWRGADNEFPSTVPQRIVEFLRTHEAWVRQIPVSLTAASENEATSIAECGTPTQSQVPSSSKKFQVPETMMPDLIRLVHGNTHGRKFLVKEFIAYMNKKSEDKCRLPKASLAKRICEIGKWMLCPDEGPMHLKACWFVTEEIRKEYLKDDLCLPNQWTYTLIPKRRSIYKEAAEKVEKEDKEKEKNVSLITQFTKKISQEEMKKQLNANRVQNSAPSSPSTPKAAKTKTPKRATLISVSRGEQFSKASKENLLKTVNVKTGNKKSEENSKSTQNLDNNDDDDVIIIDSAEDDDIDRQKSDSKKE